jgi:hypothetical protein
MNLMFDMNVNDKLTFEGKLTHIGGARGFKWRL